MEEKYRYWLLYIVIIVGAVLPPISEVPVTDPSQIGEIIGEVLASTASTFFWLSPLFHIGTILLLISFIIYQNRFGRLADLFIAIMFLFAAITQHIGYTTTFGFAIITSNLVIISIVGVFWLYETYKPQNEYVFERVSLWRYWVVPFSFLAYWFPVSPTAEIDFSLLTLISGPYGIAFCPTTPVVIGILSLIYPKVNKRLLTVTSLVGLIIGFWNMTAIFLIPGYTLFLLFLHIPLVVVPIYGLIIPFLVKPDID